MVVKKYKYRDKDGELRYTVHRTADKKFPVFQPNGRKGYGPAGPVLYNLPELLEANNELIFICEGEKDANSVSRLGFTVTTNVGGCSHKWRKSDNKYFEGHRIVIPPHNDQGGREHATDIANNLIKVAKEVRFLQLPGLSDVCDISEWIRDGGNRQKLMRLIHRQKPLTEPIKQKKSVKKKSKRSKHIKGTILKGSRTKTLMSEGGKLRRRGLDFGEICTLLLKHNMRYCKPPLPKNEVQQIAKSVSKYETLASKPDGYNRTDVRNKERFAEQHKEVMQHCGKSGGWLYFDDNCWSGKMGVKMSECLAVKTTRKILDEAKELE